MCSRVSRTIFMSCRLAPSTATLMGTPAASVSKLRFVPSFALSVGLGPVFFPAQWRFAHGSIHRQPGPIQALQTIVIQQPLHPEFLKDPGIQPLSKAPVGG